MKLITIFQMFGAILLIQVFFVLLVFCTGGGVDDAEVVVLFPFFTMVCALIYFLIMAFGKRWKAAFWGGILISAGALGIYTVGATFHIFSTIAAGWARSIVEEKIQEDLGRPSENKTVSSGLEKLSGWGWHTYIFRDPSGDTLAISDDWCGSGWKYEFRTRTWKRVPGVPWADEFSNLSALRILMMLVFAGGMAVCIFAKHKAS